MSESKKITGSDQVDRDLAELLALGDDPSRLEEAMSVIADEEASMEKLESVVTIPVFRISLALNDPGNVQALLDNTPESERPTVERAIDIAKTNLAGLETHLAVVRRMKTKLEELTRKSGKRDNLKNRISAMKWEPLWEDSEGKLMPTARVSFIDDRDELLLDSTLDWDDLAFLMHNCARILVRLFQKSEPFVKAELLDLSVVTKVSERLAGTISLLEELVSIAPTLGIDLSKQEDEQAKENPPESKTQE